MTHFNWLNAYGTTAPKAIVIHPGRAHRDEFIACCLVIGYFGFVPIYRRDSSPCDLNDPSIWVIDQGGSHDESLGNFDHHQLPRDSEARCAISLILQALGKESQARRWWQWLRFSEVLDAKGPGAVKKEFCLTDEAFVSSLSPIEAVVLDFFETHEQIQIGDVIVTLMKQIGDRLLDELHAKQERFDFLTSGGVKIEEIGELKVLVLEDNEQTRKDPALALNEWKEENCPEAAVSVTPDDRGPGLTLYRYSDHPGVDFSRIATHPEVHFAHKGGFVAKTKTTDMATARALVVLATTA